MAAQKKVAVDETLAEKDPRPPAKAPEVEPGNPEAGRRPDSGDGSRVTQRLTELRGAVVGRAQQEHPGAPFERAASRKRDARSDDQGRG